MNHKRVYRLYVEEKLSIRRKRGRRRAPAAARVVLVPPTEPDQVWTMDFTQDAFASGRRSRTLNLMDGCTREALEIEVDTSLPNSPALFFRHPSNYFSHPQPITIVISLRACIRVNVSLLQAALAACSDTRRLS